MASITGTVSLSLIRFVGALIGVSPAQHRGSMNLTVPREVENVIGAAPPPHRGGLATILSPVFTTFAVPVTLTGDVGVTFGHTATVMGGCKPQKLGGIAVTKTKSSTQSEGTHPNRSGSVALTLHKVIT